MAASFPQSFFTLSGYPFTDLLSVDRAANVNALVAEVLAMEQVLGLGVGTATSTVAAQLAALQNGKAPLVHTHSGLLTAVLGGAPNGYCVQVANNTLQGLNNGQVAPLLLQSQGGDIKMGTAGSGTTIYGSLGVGALTASGISSQGNIAAAQQISATSAQFSNAEVIETLTTSEVSTYTLSANVIDLPNGDSFTAPQVAASDGYPFTGLAQVTQWGSATPAGRQTTRKSIEGQVWIHKDPAAGQTSDWLASGLIVGTEATGNSPVSLAFAGGWDGVPAGFAAYIQMSPATSNLGFQMLGTGQGSYLPVTASAYLVGSSEQFKDDIRTSPHGLEVLRKLRPVTYTSKGSLNHIVARGNDGRVLDPKTVAHQRFLESKKRTLSVGDKRRSDQRRVGLVAEEVAEILPEVVGLDAIGRPHAIDYDALVPVLIRALQQADEHITTLEHRIQGLEQAVGA